MADPEGVDGELIGRLINSVNSPHDRDWVDLGWFLVFAVGGAELASVLPDTGKEPPPGSYGAKLRETHELVSRDVYFRRIATRMTLLVQSGLREDVLVRALRDELTARCEEFAQTEGADTRRDELRAELERPTPERIAAFRTALARKHPDVGLLSDEQIADRLLRLAANIPPITRASAQDSWDRVARWNKEAAAVSDHVIAMWSDRYAKRMLRGA